MSAKASMIAAATDAQLTGSARRFLIESGFQLIVSGSEGLMISVEATSDFTVWHSVANITAGDEPIEVLDHEAEFHHHRFYRAVVKNR